MKHKLIFVISILLMMTEARVTLLQNEFPIKIGASDPSNCDTIGSTFDVNEPME